MGRKHCTCKRLQHLSTRTVDSAETFASVLEVKSTGEQFRDKNVGMAELLQTRTSVAESYTPRKGDTGKYLQASVYEYEYGTQMLVRPALRTQRAIWQVQILQDPNSVELKLGFVE